MEHRDLLKLTTDIVSAWAANNTAKADELVSVISSVYRSLDSAGTPAATVQETPVPAVPVRTSVTPDYLVCLVDGQKLKMLKRDLETEEGRGGKECVRKCRSWWW